MASDPSPPPPGARPDPDADRVWVYGLDGPEQVDRHKASGQVPEPPSRPRRLIDPVLLLAICVGAAIGVVVWATWLRPGPGPEPITHTVAAGETLTKIARRYQVEVAQLVEWNHLPDDRLDIGQLLLVYPPGDATPAEATPKPRGSRGGRKVQGGTVTAGGEAGALSMPAPQACLELDEAALEGGDDLGMLAAEGLSLAQTRAAMDAFLPRLGSCLEGAAGPGGTVTFEVRVGCDGRVAAIGIADEGGVDPLVVGCVKERLRYAAFPAHDMPDGFDFVYPMQIELGL